MMMRARRLILLPRSGIEALGIAVIAVSACAAQTRTAEPFRWESSMSSGVLEIKGVNGSVTALPASGSVAVVEAVRSGRRSEPADVRIVVVEHAAGVTVCAVYPSTGTRANECLPGDQGRIGANNNDVRVDFVVRVPAGVDLDARTTNGEIHVGGLSGNVTARSTNGDVGVDGGESVIARTTNGSIMLRSSGYASARSTNGSIEADLLSLGNGSEPISFATTNGTVTLRLPASANANLDVRTSNGRIESEVPVLMRGTLSRNRLEGMIGSGGRLIEVRTTNGRVHLEQRI